MSRISAVFALLLLPLPASLFADDQAVDRARQALDNEPESKKIQQMSDDMRSPQVDPNDPRRRQSPAATAIDQGVSIRQMNGLLDQLEDRLNREARACNFCSEKQEELSELIRQRMALVSTGAQALGHDRAPFLLKLAGITPPGETRWSNVQIAFHESAEAVRAHCARSPQDKYCDGGGMLRAAGEHENAWAECFKKNDWVEVASRRNAYETCMSATDPLTQMWERDHNSGAGSSPYTDVWFMDVNELHFYHNRFNVDPEKLPADARLIAGQTAQMTLLEPIVAPPGPYSGNTFEIAVRARLENSLDAEASPGSSVALKNAITLDPRLASDLKGRVEAIPAGTEFPIRVWVSAPPAGAPTTANLDLMVGPMSGMAGAAGESRGTARPNTAAPGPARPTVQSRGQQAAAPEPSGQTAPPMGGRGDTRLITQRIDRQIPWPKPGAVIMPANTKLSFSTACGCLIPFTLAEFKRHLTSRAANPVTTTFATRVIAAHAGIQPALLEPVTISGIQAGKHFHAQLETDLVQPPGSSKRTDLLDVRKGTDVYFKVIDKGGLDPSQPGSHSAALVINYIVLNGKQVPLKAGELPFNYIIPVPGRRPAMPDVIIPVGMHRAWYLTEDVNIEAADLGAANLEQKVPPPERGAAADKSRRNIADYNDSWLGHGIILSGVVSRVEQVTQWDFMLHFQEPTDDSFVVCLKTGRIGPHTFDSQTGGDGFSAFVGKTVELRGLVAHPLCAPKRAGLDVMDANAVTVMGSSDQPTTANPRPPAKSSGNSR